MSKTAPLTRLLLALSILLGMLPAPQLRAQEPVTPDVPPSDETQSAADAPDRLFLPLMSGGGGGQTVTETGDASFRFRVDPLLQTVVAEDAPAFQARPATPRSNSRVLLADTELSRVQFTFEFQTGNRLVIRAAYQNVTSDALFLQPFFFSRNSRTDNIVTSTEPILSADDLGGDGILSPGETTRVVHFEVVHKGQPFTYAVDANAPVELVSGQSGPTSPAVFTGEVYDDSTGLTLSGVLVEVVTNARSISPTVTRTVTDERGRYRLVSEDRDVWVRFSKDGYTSSERAASAPGDSRVELFDARVTPLDSKQTTLPAVSGGTAAASDSRYSLTFQPFALQNDTTLTLTPLGGQSITGLLPKGWSPVAAVQITPAGLSFDPAAALAVPAPDGLPESGRIVAARWESGLQGWVAVGDAVRNGDNTALQLSVSASGQYVLLLADAPPFAPADPTIGAVLGQPASLRALPGNPDVTMSPSDRILLAEPGRNTQVGVTAIASEAMQSGMAYQVEFVESYEFVDGETIYPEPNIQDFVFYAFPGGPYRLESDFTVTPSRPFELATLRLGAVNLRLRAPVGLGLPSGELIGLNGGTATGSGGETLDFPAAATLSTLPVVVNPLDESAFPLGLPPDFTFLKGVQLDFAGGTLQRPATLSSPAPSGLTATDQLLLIRLVEVGSASRLVLAGKAQLLAGRLVADPQANDNLPFYGVRREGRYAFVKVSPARSFVYGVVAGTNGQPLAGGLVTAESRRLAALTDPNGQYVLAVPPGRVTVIFTNPQTNDQASRAGEAGPLPLQLSVSLSPTPPSVQGISPADGATGVSLSSAVVVTFTEAIDASSVTADSVRLLVNGQALPASLSITPNRRVVVLRPSQLLESDTIYTLDISTAIRDLNARPLTAAVAASFRTADTTPPPPPSAGSLNASVPEGGFSTVTGTQGTVQPDWVVVIKNQTTGALTTVLPEADGSFSVRVPAEKSHRLQLLLQDPSGNRTEVPVGRFTSPDGSVVIGEEGGIVEGEGGTAVAIPAGAFPDGTLVKVEPVLESALPITAPQEYPYAGAVRLKTDGAEAGKPLDLSIPAPADATPQDQVIVAQYVTWPTGSGWMVVDRASLQNGRYTTAGSEALGRGRAPGLGKMLPQVSGWTKNVLFDAVYGFFRGDPNECVSYVQVAVEVNYGVVSAGPFVHADVTSAQTTSSRMSYFPGKCGTTLTISAVNPYTNQLIQRITRVAPFARNSVSSAPSPGDQGSEGMGKDETAPVLVRHNLYNYSQIDTVRLTFSKEMDFESLKANVEIWNMTDAVVVKGEWEEYPPEKLYIFTPDVPFQLSYEYALILGPATDTTSNKNQLKDDVIEFFTFAPRSVMDTLEALGLLPDSQATTDIRGLLFVGHTAPVELADSHQYISVLDTRSITQSLAGPTESDVLGTATTGFLRLRAMQSLPDIFVTSRGALDFPPEFEPTRAITSILRPIPFITVTLGLTETEQIVYWLDKGIVTDTLKTVFSDGQKVAISRQAEVNRVVQDQKIRWFIHNRLDIYRVEQLDDETLQISVGRDLLAVLGTTEALSGKFETLRIYDVTPCTKPKALGISLGPGVDCIDDRYAEVSLKVLTAVGNDLGLPTVFANSSNVIRQTGVPLQMAALNSPEDEVAELYVATAGVGLQLIDVAASPNFPGPLTQSGSNLGPDGFFPSNIKDVAVHYNVVLVAELIDRGLSRLRFLDTALKPYKNPNTNEDYSLTFSNIFGVAAGRFVYDIDEDGNLGAAEDGNEVVVLDENGKPKFDPETGEIVKIPDDTRAIDELFDLALVTGDIQAGGGDALWVVDFNGLTDLRDNKFVTDTGGLRIVTSLKTPADARSIFLAPERHTAYVEMSGKGLSIIDLSKLGSKLKDTSVRLEGTAAPQTEDKDSNGKDDRILGFVEMPAIANRGDVDLADDSVRPLAFLSNFNAGVEVFTVCNNCQELVLDFGTKENWVDQNQGVDEKEKDTAEGKAIEQKKKADALLEENKTVTDILTRVVADVIERSKEITGTRPLTLTDIYIIEQGSSACMWYDTFKTNPVETCPTFVPGSSDHDYELFVPARYVAYAQSVIDDFANRSPRPEDKKNMQALDISIYAMPKEPFRAGYVLSSPPMNKSGDAAGDLGLGRQTLLLLWLMTTREYVPAGAFDESLAGSPSYGADAPHLGTLLNCLRQNQQYDWQGSNWRERNFHCASLPLFGEEYYLPVYFDPDNPGSLLTAPITVSVPLSTNAGIPPLEGYEWAILQTYNIYHYGAMLRIRGECDYDTKGNADADVFFSAAEVSGLIDPNHPDRNFDDVESIYKGCSKRVKSMAKAAIRTVFAQMVAHPLGNRLVMSGRWSDYTAVGQKEDNAAFIDMINATNPGVAFCLTGVQGEASVRDPSKNPLEYTSKPCEGFEEYVATMAIESFRRGYNIFPETDLPLIWRLWCVKVWSGCTYFDGDKLVRVKQPIANDEEATEFLRQVLDFMERAQANTKLIYNETVYRDEVMLADLTNELQMGVYPFMPGICNLCAKTYSSLGEGGTVTGTVTQDSSRGQLRLCNLKASTKLISGIPNQHQEALAEFAGKPLLVPDLETLHHLEEVLGVQNTVVYPLRVRLHNVSANELYKVPIALYEGPGRAQGDLMNLLQYYEVPYLPSGARTLIDGKKIAVPKSDPPALDSACAGTASTAEVGEVSLTHSYVANETIFPVIFAITNTLAVVGTGAEGYRALAFVADPEQELQEANRQNNQVGFYYYPLDRSTSNADIPVVGSKRVPFVLSEFRSDAICRIVTQLRLDVTAENGNNPQPPARARASEEDQPLSGSEQVDAPYLSDVTIIYTVRNNAQETLTDIRVKEGDEVIFTIPSLEPNQQVELRRVVQVDEVRLIRVAAQAQARDEEGNTIDSAEDDAYINAYEELGTLNLRFYDATSLNDPYHPWSRYSVFHDPATREEVPILGAVTDGAARLRVDVTGLEAGTQAVHFALADPLLPAATDGLGRLELQDSSGNVITGGVTIDIDDPSALIAGSEHLYYIAPGAFVRPDHHELDSFLDPVRKSPRIIRDVTLDVRQDHVGAGSTTIYLKRPPVFLFHGLGGDPSVWNDFRPVVPEGGLNLDRNAYVRGYDGRFAVFAAGTVGTVRPIAVEAKLNYPFFTAALRNRDFTKFAIENVSVVGNSMGGLISREIARQFVRERNLPAPIGRLITIGTPHLGSPLANKVVGVRFDLNHLFDLDTPIDPFTIDPNDPLAATPEAIAWIKANFCASVLSGAGVALGKTGIMIALDMYSGAMDDLQEGSQALLDLQNAGILIPTHHIVGEINNNNLSARVFNEGRYKPSEIALLWSALGLLCNWTPDQTTIEQTRLLRLSGSSVVIAATGLNPVTAIKALSFAAAEPTVIISGTNDRVVPAKSQSDGLTVTDRSVTTVIDNTDHLDIKANNVELPQIDSIARCNDYLAAAWNSSAQQPRSSLNDKNDVACQTLFLLETDPTYKNAQANDRMYRLPATASARKNDSVETAKSISTTGDATSVEISGPGVQSERAGTPRAGIAMPEVYDLAIVQPVANAVLRAGDRVTVAVALPPTVTLTSLAFGITGLPTDVPTGTTSTVITVPLESIGSQVITAIGLTAEGNYYIGYVEVLVDPGKLTSLSVIAPRTLDRVGQVEAVQVFGRYEDGVEREITAPALGTTYSSFNPAVLAVDPSGLIQAVGRGTTALQVTNKHPVTGRALVELVTVKVDIAEIPENHIPVANPGPARTVGTEQIVTLDASASSDADDDPLTYRWRQTGGRFVMLINANSATPKFVSPKVESTDTLTFELVVTDDNGAQTLPVEVKVTVNP